MVSLPGQIYLILLAIGITGLAGSGRRRKSETIVIFSVAALLPLIANRHYPLFALTLVVLAGEHIADVWNRWRPAFLAAFGRGRWITGVSMLVSIRAGRAFRPPIRLHSRRALLLPVPGACRRAAQTERTSAAIWPCRSIGESTFSGISGRV